MIGGAVKHKSLQKFNIALKKASTTLFRPIYYILWVNFYILRMGIFIILFTTKNQLLTCNTIKAKNQCFTIRTNTDLT